MKATYQTRIDCAGDALTAYAGLYSVLERRLFADLSAGGSVNALKSDYIRRYGIPARMFNSLMSSVRGRTRAAAASQKLHEQELVHRVEKAERVLRKARGGNATHQKSRRLATLRRNLERLRSDRDAGRVRICFGSRRLWRRQYDLEASGYESHAEWLRDWRDARSSEFSVIGSRDESSGCQLCVASVSGDGSLTLRLRMPDVLASEHGKYVEIPDVRFAYGHEVVLAALDSCGEYRQYRREHPEEAVPEHVGQPISYRFKRDERGWRVFVSVDVPKAPVVTSRRNGALGVDLNADHLAVTEVDPSGNPVNYERVPLVTYGKSAGQAEALIGDAVARVIAYAASVRKPVVIERLDFRRKRAMLEGESPRSSRMLSSFAYGRTHQYLMSRGYRYGVEVKEVSPAFSSLIGRTVYMERHGLTVHGASALVLARRLLGCREGVPSPAVVPLDGGGHVTLTVPARKRVRHVWSHWGALGGRLRPVLAAQRRRGRPPPDVAPAASSEQVGVHTGRESRAGVATTVGATAFTRNASQRGCYH